MQVPPPVKHLEYAFAADYCEPVDLITGSNGIHDQRLRQTLW